MSEHTKQSINNKGEIIDALLHRNLYKMPDGRQFYEASEKELEHVLYSQTGTENLCSV
ncbi:Fur-regulated basic protein FbpA [Metabacillus bambusae]|uniref:Fur-regulated basic protein FbpA n=1 Tax=Metabacillus bambusae TaxID=2795218 RepID=A0ABS3MWN7_9BACI|nr:Fur-regulated basic protein FbpA [Metabacillus bambusae]MBO1510259.1 Fur-regulated basic protein FbpA [Metabacillus bambusae]